MRIVEYLPPPRRFSNICRFGRGRHNLALQNRRDLPDLLIISISGWLQESESENAKEIINHYLLKPVDFKDLRAKIAGTQAADG